MKTSTLQSRRDAGFTLVELLTVMAVIGVLASLILMGAGFAQKKAGRARAGGEIQSLKTAIENYKVDNGIYPRSNDTDNLDARSLAALNPNTYGTASKFLYVQLTGDANNDGKIDDNEVKAGKNYMVELKSKWMTTTGFVDPFSNFYGYSTAYTKDVEEKKNPPARGFNPTYDLWSTAGAETTGTLAQKKWITNW